MKTWEEMRPSERLMLKVCDRPGHLTINLECVGCALEELREAREVIKYYNRGAWVHEEETGQLTALSIDDCEDIGMPFGVLVGGKRAREFRRKWGHE